MKELKEQLTRCKEWLKEEPDDIEVIEKVKELEAEIKKMEADEDEAEREAERLEELEKIEALRKEILSIKRRVNSKIPKIAGFEEEMMALKEIDNSIKAVNIKVLEEKILEFNKMVEDYSNKYLKESE